MGRGCSLWHVPGWVAGMGQGDLIRDWSRVDPALTLCSPQAREQDDAVEQEHVLAGIQELRSQQAGDPQKPSAQGESPSACGKAPSVCVPGARAAPPPGVGGWRGQRGTSQRCRQGSRVPCGAAGAGMLCRQSQASPVQSLFCLLQPRSRGPSCSWSCSRSRNLVQSSKMVVRSQSGSSRAPQALLSQRGSTTQPGRKGAQAALTLPRSPVGSKAAGWGKPPRAIPVLAAGAARYRTGGTGWGRRCPLHRGLAVPWAKAA